MNHIDHVRLIKKAIKKNVILREIEEWADFGSGWGAFTLALADVGKDNIEIFSIDKSKSSLDEQSRNFSKQFPNTKINFIPADFIADLQLPLLDGILMANSLHYVKDQLNFLNSLKKYLKENGKIVIVEYNLDKSNPWVPYPVNFEKFENLANIAGFKNPILLERIPLEWGNEMFSAMALK